MTSKIACSIALLTLWVGSASGQDRPTVDSLAPCPFTAAEVQSILGRPVKAADVADMRFPGSRDVACSFSVREGLMVFSVRQTWDPPPQAPVPGRRPRPIPGDPDGAFWEETQNPNERRLKLTYFRGRVGTTVEIYGGMFNEAELRPRVFGLRRVP